MISLDLKLVTYSAAADESSEADAGGSWRNISDDLPRSHLPMKLHYIGRLLDRTHSRGMGIKSFYITETEDRIGTRRTNVKLSYELLRSMVKHKADFSYGIFSSFYESSRYAIDSFYVLRFGKNYKNLFCRIISEKMLVHEFHVGMNAFGETPYIIFDAHENGLEYFFDEVSNALTKSPQRSLFLLDYFTNSPWCWVDLEPCTIAALVKLHGSVCIDVHRKMRREGNREQLLFWRHVFRTARKYLGKKDR